MNKALFLDRDGTLIDDVGYLSDINEIKLIEPMIHICKQYQEQGYKLFIVTNQSGIARGFFDEAFVKKTHNVLKNILHNVGLKIEAFYYCPHHPEFDTLACNCRKPSPGMLIRAARDYNLNLQDSLMVGDKESDVIAGNDAGCKSFLVKDLIGVISE